jgi:hypothetical protein
MVKVLKTSAEGRKCQYQNCTQTLSIYNHEAYCHIHQNQISEEQRLKNPYFPHHHIYKSIDIDIVSGR